MALVVVRVNVCDFDYCNFLAPISVEHNTLYYIIVNNHV